MSAMSAANNIVFKIINSTWQDQWTNSLIGSFYKATEPLISHAIKFKSTPRHKETCMTRIRLGNCWTNARLHKIKCHENGLCQTCQVPETVEHYLLHCIKQAALQEMLKTACKSASIAYTLNTVLTNSSCIDMIYSWIIKSNRRL